MSYSSRFRLAALAIDWDMAWLGIGIGIWGCLCDLISVINNYKASAIGFYEYGFTVWTDAGYWSERFCDLAIGIGLTTWFW